MSQSTKIKPSLPSQFFESQNWKPFLFQKKCWKHVLDGQSGLLNAPTGSGKTYALLAPILQTLHHNPSEHFQAIWVCPIRALTKEIHHAAQRMIQALKLNVQAEVRTGDTTTSRKQLHWKKPPDLLITTPESIHVLLSKQGYSTKMQGLKYIVVDEWHDMMGTKRGVQVELAMTRIHALNPTSILWGISATIGNIEEAIQVLLATKKEPIFVRANIKKKISVTSIIPKDIHSFPWAGYLGIRMLKQVIPVIKKHTTTLIFTNTRSQCEIWYQQILEASPDLAGLMAMHHSSIAEEQRHWVEDSLKQGKLKVVVCTSSLDLGVDFHQVDGIIQIGGPKGVARFVQRAGRSGHKPGASSKIYFAPTHALELVEALALKQAIKNNIVEPCYPMYRCFDVLVQYMMTLAISEGFCPDTLYKEILQAHCYETVTTEEWQWCVNYLISGSDALQAYDEYKKLGLDSGGIVRPLNQKVAKHHRLSIGTIVSDQLLVVRYMNGRKLGNIEETFIAQLNPGTTFWFTGKALLLNHIKGDDVYVEPSKKPKGRVPSWLGSRMSLSSEMADELRYVISESNSLLKNTLEIKCLKPLLETQLKYSVLPKKNQLLVEKLHSADGYHIFIYPFEGRVAHEGLGGLIAYRLSKNNNITFSIAMNDYGIEILSDKKINLVLEDVKSLFDSKHLRNDLDASINKLEMARRRFREIAAISGLTFQGYPSQRKRAKHLQSSSAMLFDVFSDYDDKNLLYRQSYEEAMILQYEESRIRKVLQRMEAQEHLLVELEKPSLLSFPILVDRKRDRISSEKLSDQIHKMQIDIQ